MSGKLNIYVNQFNTSTNRNLLPLAAGKIIAYARSRNELSAHYNFRIEVLRIPPQEMVDSYDDPRVLGFSCYMWNLAHSLEVARLAKQKFPNVLNVVGGPSTYRDPILITQFMEKHPFIDVVVSGEGELTFSDLLGALLNSQTFNDIPGLSFRAGENIIINPARKRVKELDQLPSPFLDGTFDELLVRHKSVFTGAVWETTRGCPFACSFCDWGQSTFSKVNEYSLMRIQSELEWMGNNEINYIFNADANFGIKKRDILVAELIAECKTRTGFPRVFSVSWVKNTTTKIVEIAEKLEAAGISSQVTLSVQSFDDKTLEAANRTNIPIEKLRDLKRVFNQKGVDTYTEILLGLAQETYESFSNGIVEAMSPYVTDHFVIYLVRMLENTEITDPEYVEKYGIRSQTCVNATPRRTHNEAAIIEHEKIVIATASLPVESWKKAYLFGYFCAGLYNFRIINVLSNYLRYTHGVSIKDYYEYLIAEADERFPMLFRIIETLKSYRESILSGKEAVFQVAEFGETKWNPDEACYLLISLNIRLFFMDIRAITLKYLNNRNINFDANELLEAIYFQYCIVPVYENLAIKDVPFSYNWVHFYGHMGEAELNKLRVEPVVIHFNPLHTVAETGVDFARLYIGNNNSGSSAVYEISADMSAASATLKNIPGIEGLYDLTG